MMTDVRKRGYQLRWIDLLDVAAVLGVLLIILPFPSNQVVAGSLASACLVLACGRRPTSTEWWACAAIVAVLIALLQPAARSTHHRGRHRDGKPPVVLPHGGIPRVPS